MHLPDLHLIGKVKQRCICFHKQKLAASDVNISEHQMKEAAVYKSLCISVLPNLKGTNLSHLLLDFKLTRLSLFARSANQTQPQLQLTCPGKEELVSGFASLGLVK